jgi:hypothetical protein
MKNWVIWIVVIFVGGSIFSACTSADRNNSGEVVDPGTVSAFEIQEGDCLTDSFLDSNDSFTEVNAVPCDEPHAYEAYFSTDLEGETYPSDVSLQAGILCELTLAGLIDGIVEDSAYTFVTTMPSQASWESSRDRQVMCLVGMRDGSDKMGRIRK